MGAMDNVDVGLVACRPALLDPEWPEDLQKAFLDLPPLEEGKLPGKCEFCGMEVMIGPRQLSHLNENPSHMVVCMFCALRLLMRAGGSAHDIHHLGGP